MSFRRIPGSFEHGVINGALDWAALLPGETGEVDMAVVDEPGFIGRALTLIDVVAAARRPLTLTEIAHEAGLPKTTALRLRNSPTRRSASRRRRTFRSGRTAIDAATGRRRD